MTAAEPRRVLDVLIIGAGFAGIGAGIKLQQRGQPDFLIVDKAAGIGGTWWHNTYPGAACDIQSHLYCYSFAPNPHWSRKFSPQPEIQSYIENCADRFGLRDRIRLNCAVSSLELKDDGLWHAELENAPNLTAHHVILATGALHLAKYPDLPGRERFAGPSMHSAHWDHSVTFAGKRVAVIGSAASAIQLIPELAREVSQLDVYQRTPNYIAPRNDAPYSAATQGRFARYPWLNRLYRQWIFLRGEWLLFPVVKSRQRGRWRSFLQNMIHSHIRRSVNSPELANSLLPDYSLGCKRMLISDDYYATLDKPQVTLRTQRIQSVVEDGLVTDDGEHHRADIIVYATGFDLETHIRALPIRGQNGISLDNLWSHVPRAYKGSLLPGMPNLYMVTGPNTGVGTSSVVYMIEAQLQTILQAIELAGREQHLQVSRQAYERYNHELSHDLQQTVWAGDCNSWYKREDGEISVLYPHNARSFRREHQTLTAGDLLLTPRPGAAPEEPSDPGITRQETTA